MLRKLKALVLFLVVLTVSWAAPSIAGEYSISTNSTVIGKNFGFPEGIPPIDKKETGNLDLVSEIVLYGKNLELIDVGIDGETFIGFFVPLRLRYRPHEQITIEAGSLLGYDFGDGDTFDELEPILRLVYEPADDTYIVAGTLFRTHTIHDALWDDNTTFNDNTEQGFQFRADLVSFKNDTWINWRSKETKTRSERFDAASVSRFIVDSLWLDAQVFLRHTGGQKNTEDTVDYNTSYLVGASYGFLHGQSVPLVNSITEVRAGGYYIGDIDTPDDKSGLDNTDGSGVEGTVTIDTKPSDKVDMRIFFSYFKGDDLLARAGDPLYRKDEYIQIGTNIIFSTPAGSSIEAGAVGQFADSTFVYTFQLYFLWGKNFPLLNNI